MLGYYYYMYVRECVRMARSVYESCKVGSGGRREKRGSAESDVAEPRPESEVVYRGEASVLR